MTPTRISFSIGAEASHIIEGSGCITLDPCGLTEELISRVLVRGYGMYLSSTNLNLTLDPSASRVLNISLPDTSDGNSGFLVIRTSDGHCLLWSTTEATTWIKGGLLLLVADLPSQISIANPNVYPIQVQILLASRGSGLISITDGLGLSIE